MKLLLDMGLAQSTAQYLREQGYDVVHLREQGLHKMDDNAIMRKARIEGRVIITHDLGFGRILALGQNQLPSVIILRLADMRPAQVNRILTRVLNLVSQQLDAGALVSVSDRTIRVRLLPIAR